MACPLSVSRALSEATGLLPVGLGWRLSRHRSFASSLKRSAQPYSGFLIPEGQSGNYFLGSISFYFAISHESPVSGLSAAEWKSN